MVESQSERDVISPQDAANLRWMAIANSGADGVGLFYPTACRCGEMNEMRPLVEAGLCTYRRPDPPKSARGKYREDRRAGYWITDTGLAELNRLNRRDDDDK